ncbi:MAG: DUF4160 domain-containing protein [Bacteroidetes bacterium]|nr:DUF4160 domain-containing protein [Bacteroidota bacterium]
MFMEAGEPHHTPHFHAYFQSDVAVFSIEPVEMIAGTLPRKQIRLVEAWGELHTDELKTCWELLQSGHAAFKIDPLQ